MSLFKKGKRSAKPKEPFEPTPFMIEAGIFCERKSTGSTLPDTCIELLSEALDAFVEDPASRSRSYWAFEMATGEVVFSLLGMVCLLQGLPLLDMARNEHELPCREALSDLGFTAYDVLCLNEIDQHSLNMEVLQERIALFCQTGERMPFIDHLHEQNVPEGFDGQQGQG